MKPMEWSTERRRRPNGGVPVLEHGGGRRTTERRRRPNGGVPVLGRRGRVETGGGARRPAARRGRQGCGRRGCGGVGQPDGVNRFRAPLLLLLLRENVIVGAVWGRSLIRRGPLVPVPATNRD